MNELDGFDPSPLVPPPRPHPSSLTPRPSMSGDDAKDIGGGFHVVLVEPEIAGNTGAIGRTCVAVGATLWLVRPLGFRLDDRHRRRAGLDYWEHLNCRVVDHLEEVVAALGRDRLWSFSTKAEKTYTHVTYRRGDGLVFGPESRGLPGAWTSSRPDRLVRIPIRPEARSLNLGTAVAIALFEAVRQVDGAGNEAAPGIRGRIETPRT